MVDFMIYAGDIDRKYSKNNYFGSHIMTILSVTEAKPSDIPFSNTSELPQITTHNVDPHGNYI
jgi:hypothetical protein